METLNEIFDGKQEMTSKELSELRSSITSSSCKKKLGRIISARKKKYVNTKDYVSIVDLSRYLSDYEKDKLFLELLKVHPTSSLFVLGFANSDMHSYAQAYKMETIDHDNDEEALKKDIESIFDSTLCKFISKHDMKEDLDYVHELVDGATWLEVYKRVTIKLSQL
jgi:hypothetical protein